MPRVTPPVVGADSRFFWDGVARGELLLQRCATCGALRHPPGPMCPECQSLDWEPTPSHGRGRVYSWIVSQPPTGDDLDERIVVLVALDDGVRMVANLVDVDRSDVRTDLAVEVCYRDVDGVRLPQFRPAPTGET